MIKRWQGNSGRVQHLPESWDRPAPPRKPEAPQQSRPPARPQTPAGQPQRKRQNTLPGLENITKLIPGKLESLETEDIILLLILYLMYRESGDSELLMIMGAMFLL